MAPFLHTRSRAYRGGVASEEQFLMRGTTCRPFSGRHSARALRACRSCVSAGSHFCTGRGHIGS
eukprot:7138194-Lingulodinium_polyedra.AAC.1